MATYNFKSVGITDENRTKQQLTTTPVPVGIKTPLRPGQADGIFALNYSLADQMHDNLRNLLLTNWGERLGFYDFGANLRPLTAEFVSEDDFDSQAITRINGAVRRWMPYISLEDYVSTVNHTQNKNTGIIQLTVSYSIPALNVKNKQLVIVLYVM